MSERVYGKVKWYNREKGYGFFIVVEGNSSIKKREQVFFHIKGMLKAGIDEDDIVNGLNVSFVEVDNKGRPMASDIKLEEDDED